MHDTPTIPVVDLRGKTITTYVVYHARAALGELAVGQRLELVTDAYPAMTADIPAWCRMAGHRLVDAFPDGEAHHFVIERGAEPEAGKRLAMIISGDGLLELLSPLGFALAAALESIEVHLFFQGPAVHVLAKGFRPRLRGWARPFSRLAASGMAKAGHLPAQTKLAQLRALGAKLYVCGPSMEHFKVARDQLIFEDLRIVEYLTFMSVMEEADIQLYL